jgi:hypothetical protein
VPPGLILCDPPALLATTHVVQNPAARKANTKITSILAPPDPGQNRLKTIDLQRNMTVRNLPQTPRGEVSQEQNQKQP